ncbi:MAG: tetratricopeptide repeat protein [Ignavibacteria bacterium]
MKKIILLIVFVLYGCSQKAVIEKEQRSEVIPTKTDPILTIKNLEAKKHFIQGLTYSLQDLPEKAIIEFQEAIIFEDNPSINFALAVQLYKINKIDLSLKYLEKAITLPDSVIHLDFLLIAAQIYLTKGNVNKAISQLERIIKIDSTNLDALYNLAQIIETKDKEKSKTYYEKIISIQPDNRNALESLLNYYYEKRDYVKSEELLKDLIFNEPYELELRLRLVGLYREWGKEDSAKVLLNEINERFPDDVISKLYLIEISIDEKKYSEAITLVRNVIELSKDNQTDKISVYDYITSQSIKDSVLRKNVNEFLIERLSENDTLALTYFFIINLIEEPNDQIDKLFSKIELNDTNLDILKKFSSQLYVDGKYQQSIFLLKKIYTHFENDFNVNVTFGQAYLILEDFSNAVYYLKKSAELSFNNPELWNAISYALGKLKKYDEAIEYSEKALSIDNKNKNSLINLGLILDDAGYFDKCDSLYEEALKIYPDDPTLLNNYAYSLAKRKVNLDKALAMSKKSLEKDSLVDSYLDTLGWIYYQMGKFEEAEYYIKLAIDQGSPSSEILEHMGDVYIKMSKTEEAKEYYRMALKLNPENQDLKQKLEKIE